MTNTELLYLLAAARGSVLQHKERLLDCDHDAETCTCDLAAQKIALLARIDAALAAHDAVPPSEVKVEWRLANGPHVFLAHLNDADMALRVDWDRWYWKVTREGHTTTLDEAKSAAIAAARGM